MGSYADITASSVGVERRRTEGKPVRLFNMPPVRRGVFFNSAADLLQDTGHFRPQILMYFFNNSAADLLQDTGHFRPQILMYFFNNSAADLLQDTGHFRPQILMYFPLVV